MHVAGSDSNKRILTSGVPQGSVIGPKAFTMYITPVSNILRLHNIKYHTYADDIQVYLEFDPIVPNDAECALFRLSSCISDIQSWFITNKLN